MPGYSDMTAVQQQYLDNLLLLLRPATANDIYKVAERLRVINQMWFNTPSDTATTMADLVNAWTAGELAPNNTDLPQAASVTKEGIQSAMGYVGTIAAHDTVSHLNVLLPFAGGNRFQ